VALLSPKSELPTKERAFDNDKTPSNHNKRLEDVLEYEVVDNELRDLLVFPCSIRIPRSGWPEKKSSITHGVFLGLAVAILPFQICPHLVQRANCQTDKTPSNHNKRLEDVLEYEAVDDELRDLLKRLLNQQPPKRNILEKVKHHP